MQHISIIQNTKYLKYNNIIPEFKDLDFDTFTLFYNLDFEYIQDLWGNGAFKIIYNNLYQADPVIY